MVLRLIFFVFVLLTSLTAFSAQTLLVLGDSLTEGYGISKEKAFPAVLEKLLREKKYDVSVLNAGISASTSASAESRLKWQLKSKPTAMVLALGANDGLRGLPTASMEANLAKAIELARGADVPVILAGMKIPMNYGEAYRSSYEKVFSDLAKKYSLVFAPFLLEGVGAIPALNQADGIHPNEKGHEIIARNLLPYAEKVLRRP